jgi:hypothetical protein
MAYRNRLIGGGYKPEYAADFGNVLIVNNTLKRQYKLSGMYIGDERK